MYVQSRTKNLHEQAFCAYTSAHTPRIAHAFQHRAARTGEAMIVRAGHDADKGQYDEQFVHACFCTRATSDLSATTAHTHVNTGHWMGAAACVFDRCVNYGLHTHCP